MDAPTREHWRTQNKKHRSTYKNGFGIPCVCWGLTFQKTQVLNIYLFPSQGVELAVYHFFRHKSVSSLTQVLTLTDPLTQFTDTSSSARKRLSETPLPAQGVAVLRGHETVMLHFPLHWITHMVADPCFWEDIKVNTASDSQVPSTSLTWPPALPGPKLQTRWWGGGHASEAPLFWVHGDRSRNGHGTKSQTMK